LRAHPDAFVCQPKEPHYFAFAGQSMAFCGPGDEATINRAARTKRDDFLALFPEHGSTPYTALGDGSVSSLYYHEHAIPAIREINPAMRIVMVLRDPVDRAYSSYQYLRVRGFEPVDDFMRAVALEDDRREAGWHHLWHYTGMSYYAESVGHYLSNFDREQIGVWFYDDLTARPEACVHEIYAFLGLDPSRVEASLPRVNVSGQPRRRSAQTLIAWAGRHEAVRAGLKRLVPFRVRERVRAANLRPTAVSPQDRAELIRQFAPDVDKLSDILDKRVPGWTRG
jgi:Sulfotransferase domain